MDERVEATKMLYRLAMEIAANGATPERVERYEEAKVERGRREAGGLLRTA